jgi:nucleotide-binding universal stress UspA family protein
VAVADQSDRQEPGMFKRIAVAFDESPGAWHALASAISLAKVLNAQLHTVTVVEPSAYEPYVGVVPTFLANSLEFYEGLQQRAAIEGEGTISQCTPTSLLAMKLKPLWHSSTNRKWTW